MKRLMSICAVILFSGCAGANLKFEPVPTPGQKEVYERGIGVLTSVKRNAVVVAPDPSVYNESDSPTIAVYVVNNSTSEFNFSTENIKAYVDGESVKVYTYEELYKDIQRKASAAAFGAVLNSVVQSANAANERQTTDFTATTSNGINAVRGSVATVKTGLSAREQREIQRDAAANMSGIEARRHTSLQNLNSAILRKTTIMPGAIDGGYIILGHIPMPQPSYGRRYEECRRRRFSGDGSYDGSCEYLREPDQSPSTGLQKWANVKIAVVVDGETHEFSFKHSKI